MKMMELISFKAEHLTYLLENGLRDKSISPYYKKEYGPLLEKTPEVYTIVEDGVPLVIGGFRHYWKNRGEAWLLFGEIRTKHFLTIFRLFKKAVDKCSLKRIEAIIEHDFEEGHRWVKLFGFKKEAECLKNYLPGGQDVSLYALIRG